MKQKVLSDIRENGQICSTITRGITPRDREIIDQLHAKIRLKYFTQKSKKQLFKIMVKI